MFAECDAEFFMVLPRIVLLGFLRAPTNDMLMKSFLPHCFSHEDAKPDSAQTSTDFQFLLDRFRGTQRYLVDAQTPQDFHSGESAEGSAWKILISRAVIGTSPGGVD